MSVLLSGGGVNVTNGCSKRLHRSGIRDGTNVRQE